LLAVAALAAVAWASLDPAGYAGVAHLRTARGVGPLLFPGDVEAWIDDAAMALFFLVVGLELSRELAYGELSDRRVALLPMAGAAGGMAGAALAYLAVAHGGELTRGAGVPTATDIAFAVGALAVLGRRVPAGLRLFVLALAVADDLGSLAVLVLGYSSRIDALRLGVALACVALLALLRRRGVRPIWVYLLVGLLCWAALVSSGVEPALAGVAAGLALPPDGGEPGLLELRVGVVADLVVLPLFALANVGVDLASGLLSAPGAERVLVATTVARVVGKSLGVSLATLLAVRLVRGHLPDGVGAVQLAGGGLICGVGFTVPLLVADRAFAGAPALLAGARAGLLLGSAVAFVAGAVVLSVASRGRAGPR
jgi:NhaA family Na+:H+ antiporter